jgi:hypothetical protein
MKIHGYFKTETVYQETIEITEEKFNKIIADYIDGDIPLEEALEDDMLILEALGEAGLLSYDPKNAREVDGGVDFIKLEIIN